MAEKNGTGLMGKIKPVPFFVFFKELLALALDEC
jgi:hypothetical protein